MHVGAIQDRGGTVAQLWIQSSVGEARFELADGARVSAHRHRSRARPAVGRRVKVREWRRAGVEPRLLVGRTPR